MLRLFVSILVVGAVIGAFQNCANEAQFSEAPSVGEEFFNQHVGNASSLCTGMGTQLGNRTDVFNFRASEVPGVAHWTHRSEIRDANGNLTSSVSDGLVASIRDALQIEPDAASLTLAQCREICQRVFNQAGSDWTGINCWLHQDQNYGTAARYTNSLNIFWLETGSIPYGSAACDQAYETRNAPQSIAHVQCTSLADFRTMVANKRLVFSTFTLQ